MPPAFNSSRSLPAVGSDCQKAIRPGPFEIRARFRSGPVFGSGPKFARSGNQLLVGSPLRLDLRINFNRPSAL